MGCGNQVLFNAQNGNYVLISLELFVQGISFVISFLFFLLTLDRESTKQFSALCIRTGTITLPKKSLDSESVSIVQITFDHST